RGDHEAPAGTAAHFDRALAPSAGGGAPARCHHACERRSGADEPRQSGRAPTRPVEGSLRAGRRLSRRRPTSRLAYFRKPENFFWKRDRRPARSSSCCWPPVQAGCDFGSISRRSVSPSLPQVLRVVNSVPSVITTLIM